MESEIRRVMTDEGEICYTLTRKRVKRLNLRLDAGGTVQMSIPRSCPTERADELIQRHCGWITERLRRREEEKKRPLLPELSRKEAESLLRQSVERMLPLVAPLGVTMPEMRVRKMTSWGICHWSKGYITLNLGLHRCPEPLRDYVALHELIHFLHHDHGKGFYAVLDRLMPDWPERRKELHGYAAALKS